MQNFRGLYLLFYSPQGSFSTFKSATGAATAPTHNAFALLHIHGVAQAVVFFVPPPAAKCTYRGQTFAEGQRFLSRSCRECKVTFSVSMVTLQVSRVSMQDSSLGVDA